MRAASAAARPAATKQTLAPVQKNQIVDKPVKYIVDGKDVELSIALTQQYFCQDATPAEAFMFNAWCAHNGLDPWRKEAYLTKRGGKPVHITAKEAFTKRAESNPRYQGQEAGVVVINRKGELENRVGEIVLDGETLVGGWADVYVKDYVKPVSSSISFKERCQYKDGKPQATWATSPGLMIRKCALVAALREAFPSNVGGMYIPEEMGYEEDNSASTPIDRSDYQDVTYTDMTTGEVVEPDDDEPSIFDTEG